MGYALHQRMRTVSRLGCFAQHMFLMRTPTENVVTPNQFHRVKKGYMILLDLRLGLLGRAICKISSLYLIFNLYNAN